MTPEQMRLLADHLAQIAQALYTVREEHEQAAQARLCAAVDDLRAAARGDAGALGRLRQESLR